MTLPWLIDLFRQRRIRRLVLTPYQPPPPAVLVVEPAPAARRRDGRPECPGCRAPFTSRHRLCDFCRSTGEVA